MSALGELVKVAQFEQAKRRLTLPAPPGPEAVLDDIRGTGFYTGQRVFDSITGQEVEVVATGVKNIDSQSAGS